METVVSTVSVVVYVFSFCGDCGYRFKGSMCPLYPIHWVLTYGALVLLMWFLVGVNVAESLTQQIADWSVCLADNDTKIELLKLVEGETVQLRYVLKRPVDPGAFEDDFRLEERHSGPSHLTIFKEEEPSGRDSDPPLQDDRINVTQEGSFSVTADLLGYSQIVMESKANSTSWHTKPLRVEIMKGRRIMGIIFVHVVIMLVVVVYINMGCAIDLSVIRETLKKPVSPLIGLSSQYLFMPLISLVVGYLLFYPNDRVMWLGLFVTGCSPGGGGSNMWTYLFEGSLDLSVTMTFISTIAAFALLPLWIFMVAPTIFDDSHTTYEKLPYRSIAAVAAGVIVPLAIGVLMKRYLPKVASVLKRLLKAVSLFFIIVVFTLGIYAYSYVFLFFTWKIAIASMCLPWLGFSFGAIVGRLCRRSWEDVIAISIETGIQNTGISVGIILVSLKQLEPLGETALIIPIMVATMTPIPLAVILIAKKISSCKSYTLCKTDMDKECVMVNSSHYLNGVA